jgi:hypothetical protein
MTTADRALDFVATLEAPASPFVENLRASAFGLQSHGNQSALDLVLEELGHFNCGYTSEATKRSAAIVVAKLLSEMLAEEVGSWDEFHEWLSKQRQPCDIDAFKQRAAR